MALGTQSVKLLWQWTAIMVVALTIVVWFYIYSHSPTQQRIIPPKPMQTSVEYNETYVTETEMTNSSVHPGSPTTILPDTTNEASGESSYVKFIHDKKSLEAGCVVGLYFNDQQTGSLANVLSCQCWATSVNMVVVEPIMINSKFGTPLVSSQLVPPNEQVPFTQIFSLEDWRKANPQPPLAPLVTWKDFLLNGPKHVVLANFGEGWSHQNSPVHECSVARKEYSDFLKRHDFKVVREVCVEHIPPMTTQEFNSFVFGNYTSNVSVIFSEWGGVSRDRIKLSNSQCNLGRFFSFGTVKESKNVSRHASTYIHTFFNNRNYIAVMIRMEYLVRRTLSEKKSVSDAVANCLDKVKHEWQILKKDSGVNSTLLTLDWGKLGSMYFSVYFPELWDLMKEPCDKFFESIYGTVTMDEWEQTFVSVTGTSSPGYNAMVQKSIAARAKCIMTVGTGTFQSHAISLYKLLHPKDQCRMKLNVHGDRVTYSHP